MTLKGVKLSRPGVLVFWTGQPHETRGDKMQD
ncbi:hypothetical protein CCACVL1_09574 [Corchorus capsularis]|uniref:Uncharacterized protein n=1 Tax=Corchorus capsularis TaxID=210143 RepID=A0A1R3IVB4_COCAP|nr:hypothetical protein CCACVL1_09574 [Corchorus capsularis]